MSSESVSKSQLCGRCASWDLGHLFRGDANDAHMVGPFTSPRSPRSQRTWDLRALNSVQHNFTCKLCQFIYGLVITSSAWTEARRINPKAQFYLNYKKEDFCSLFQIPGTGMPKERITALALELLDNQNPEESSSELLYINYPSLQCYRFGQPQDGEEPQNLLEVRRLKAQVDFDLIQQWIRSCNGHGEACSNGTRFGKRASRIRLIDIHCRRLVWMTTSEVYAAISYVWGPPSLEQARLTRSTQAGLFLDGALADDNESIPRTIRDAMTVCERLGIPYLWVDALCIEQDSSDFDVHLQKMNDIYAAAYLTIVAACGADSWNGLSGVAPGSREIYQPSIIIDDMEIGLAVPEFWTSVMYSPWASRGWTFQERLFSRRMLIFTKKQCFFYCDKLTRFESTVTEVDGENEGMVQRFLHGVRGMEHRFLYPHLWAADRQKLSASNNTSSKAILLGYFQLFRHHRRLSLTYEADVLKAFGGVISKYEQQMSSAFYFGMPTSMFTYALLLDCTQCIRRPEFPSWSWAGWSRDREDILYSGSVLGSETAVLFYRLHPTLNSKGKQDQWILTAINDRETQGAAEARLGMDPVLFQQHLPEHLTRMDLERLLLFDTEVLSVDFRPAALSQVPKESYRPDPGGEGFDRVHNMTFASIRVLGVQETRDNESTITLGSWGMLYPPYFPQDMFSRNGIGELVSELLELILIARRDYAGDKIVWLMVINTDDKGISTRLSFCALYQEVWSRYKPKRRRVYLM